MAKIIWSESALDDLEQIAEFIALSNPIAASNLVKDIFLTVDRLGEFPESGRIPTELDNLNYREVVANPCRIFYRYEDATIFVVHVFRQERDIRRFLLNQEKNG